MSIDFNAELVDPIFDEFGLPAVYTDTDGVQTNVTAIYRRDMNVVPDGVEIFITDFKNMMILKESEVHTLRNGETITIGADIYTIDELFSNNGHIVRAVVR